VRNAAATRAAMLVAARRRFLEESYDNVSLREIAGDAGVDVALVNRYFGSKEALFKEVLSSGKKKFDGNRTVDELPEYLASVITDEDCGEEPNENVERLLIILRSASSAKAAEIVSNSMREDVLEPFVKLLDGRDPEMRASLCMALIMGAKVQRTIMGVDPAECDSRAFEQRLVEMFKVALAEGPSA
jgi:AcrR family transcriptional regulator